ncbi:MAG: DsbA family protein [Candidatus Nitrosocosmicus sp.]|nr:DsbA family protein [Candidatus Nitrosocosmicus sp.]
MGIQFNNLHAQSNDDVLEIITQLENNSMTPTLGNPNANITVIEFGDYQCIHCANFNKDQKDLLLSNYNQTGIAKFLFKDFPINDQNNGMSTLAARATYCAAEQDKYWEYHDEIFRNHDNRQDGKIQRNDLDNYAKQVSIADIEQFRNCLESNKYSDIVVENNRLAQQLNITSTPTFVVYSKNDTQLTVVKGVDNHTQLEGARLMELVSN